MIPSSHFHPMLVHFPIALIMVGFLFDLLSFILKKELWLTKAGFWLEILGMAGAVAAFATGYFLTNQMEGETGIMREKHELFATFSLVSIIVAVIFRIVFNYLNKNNLWFRILNLGLLLISLIFISFTGYLGGSLVMDYMIGL